MTVTTLDGSEKWPCKVGPGDRADIEKGGIELALSGAGNFEAVFPAGTQYLEAQQAAKFKIGQWFHLFYTPNGQYYWMRRGDVRKPVRTLEPISAFQLTDNFDDLPPPFRTGMMDLPEKKKPSTQS